MHFKLQRPIAAGFMTSAVYKKEGGFSQKDGGSTIGHFHDFGSLRHEVRNGGVCDEGARNMIDLANISQ